MSHDNPSCDTKDEGTELETKKNTGEEFKEQVSDLRVAIPEQKEDFIVGTERWLSSRKSIYKNLIAIGFAWIFLFTAYSSIANLQSSLNRTKGLGTAGLATIYVSLVISCLFLPPAMIKNLGLKWTIIISQCTYTIYMAANIYPRWYTIIPGKFLKSFKNIINLKMYIKAAIILGSGAAPLWTGIN